MAPGAPGAGGLSAAAAVAHAAAPSATTIDSAIKRPVPEPPNEPLNMAPPVTPLAREPETPLVREPDNQVPGGRAAYASSSAARDVGAAATVRRLLRMRRVRYSRQSSRVARCERRAGQVGGSGPEKGC